MEKEEAEVRCRRKEGGGRSREEEAEKRREIKRVQGI